MKPVTCYLLLVWMGDWDIGLLDTAETYQHMPKFDPTLDFQGCDAYV